MGALLGVREAGIVEQSPEGRRHVHRRTAEDAALHRVFEDGGVEAEAGDIDEPVRLPTAFHGTGVHASFARRVGAPRGHCRKIPGGRAEVFREIVSRSGAEEGEPHAISRTSRQHRAGAASPGAVAADYGNSRCTGVKRLARDAVLIARTLGEADVGDAVRRERRAYARQQLGPEAAARCGIDDDTDL